MTHPDPIDEAAEREQQLIAVALANRPRPAVEFTGKCHYCEAGRTMSERGGRPSNAQSHE